MYLRLTQVQGQNSGHNPNNYRIANPFGTSTEWPSYSTAYLAGINERVSKKIKYDRYDLEKGDLRLFELSYERK
ncbi:611_t:CDS:2 [Funneliformis geosporum]|nr:611_t:CDS:2 [Funneliformis geosporum]